MMSYKCAKYLRLSKEDDDKKDESSSIESQRMIIESFCKFQGLELVEEYVDDGYSGGNFNRPAFQRLISDIESGHINCVVTKDISRLGRELYQTGSIIEQYFIDHGVRYIAINDGYDSLNGDSMISMRLTFNDYYLRDISKKVKTAFNARQKNGEYIGSIPKYGYKKDPNDHHKLIIDVEPARVVRRIYDMTLQGMGLHKICTILSDEQIPIPSVYKKETRGLNNNENNGNGIWRAQTIRDILKSEIYIGNMVQNTYNKVRYNSKKIRATDPSEYIIVPNTHEAIIDKDTFYKVQEIMKNRKFNSKPKENIFLFTGLLKCKECGATISILKKKTKKNGYYFTQCNRYSKKGRYGVCNNHRINYSLLEDDLLNIISEVSRAYLEQYNQRDLYDEANKLLNKDLNQYDKEIEDNQLNIFKYNKAIESLYLDKSEGKITESLFDKLVSSYNDNIEFANQKIRTLNEQKNKRIKLSTDMDFDECALILKNFLDSKKPSRKIILNLVEKVEIDNDKNVELFFKFPQLTTFLN